MFRVGVRPGACDGQKFVAVPHLQGVSPGLLCSVEVVLGDPGVLLLVALGGGPSEPLAHDPLRPGRVASPGLQETELGFISCSLGRLPLLQKGRAHPVRSTLHQPPQGGVEPVPNLHRNLGAVFGGEDGHPVLSGHLVEATRLLMCMVLCMF